MGKLQTLFAKDGTAVKATPASSYSKNLVCNNICLNTFKDQDTLAPHNCYIYIL